MIVDGLLSRLSRHRLKDPGGQAGPPKAGPQAKSNESVKIVGVLDYLSVNLPNLKCAFHSKPASTVSHVI